MKKIILCLAVLLSLTSCNNDSLDQNLIVKCGQPKNIPIVKVNYCLQPLQPTKTLSTVVIDSQEKLNEVLVPCYWYWCEIMPLQNKANVSATSVMPYTVINFEKEMVVAVLSGEKPSGGYVVKIESITEDDCQVLVNYSEKTPTPGSAVTMALTYPYDMALIPKTKKPVLFKKVTTNTDYIILGKYNEGTLNSQSFYKLDSKKTEKYITPNFISNESLYDFDTFRTEIVTIKPEYTTLVNKIPAEILNLTNQTKKYTFTNEQPITGVGYVYIEISLNNNIRRVYIPLIDTKDQSEEVIEFKKNVYQLIAKFESPE